MKITINFENGEMCKILNTMSEFGNREMVKAVVENNIEATGRNLMVNYSTDEDVLTIKLESRIVKKIVESFGVLLSNVKAVVNVAKMFFNSMDEDFDDIKVTKKRSTMGTQTAFMIGAWNPRNPMIDTIWVEKLENGKEIEMHHENIKDCVKFDTSEDMINYYHNMKLFENKNCLTLGIFKVKYKLNGDKTEIVEKRFFGAFE